MEAKVAIICADGFEEIEALTVVDILRRSNISCNIISIKNEMVKGSHGICVKADDIISKIDKNEYKMIVLPGGLPGATNLENCDELISWIKQFAKNTEKYIAAICAAPQVFAKADVIRGRKVTSYPANEFKEVLKEANYIDDDKQTVVIDGNIITSKGPATAFDFAYTLVQVLGKDVVELKKSMLYDLY